MPKTAQPPGQPADSVIRDGGVAMETLFVFVGIAGMLYLFGVLFRRSGPAVDDPATDRQRRYIGHLVAERNIANPPDPNDRHLTKSGASALIDELLAIPEAGGDFDRTLNNPLTRWWKTLNHEARIAWYLQKQEYAPQRSMIYSAVRDSDEDGTLREQNRRLAQILDRMIADNHVRRVVEHGETGYRLTETGEKLVPPPADHLRLASR